MTILTLISGIEQIFGNGFALLAAVGTFVLLLTTFNDDTPSQLVRIINLGIFGFVAGILGQISIIVMGTTVNTIGIIYPLSPNYVNDLLMLSFGFLILRMWLRSNRYRFS